MEGEAFKNTSWVNHFETQSIEIGGLNNELYEFKTVGRNDYPDNNNVNSRSESPASDVTEGRPLPSTTSKYRTSLSQENATIGDKLIALTFCRMPIMNQLNNLLQVGFRAQLVRA